eukprot:4909821-Pyramimonas_sp.AAC.1
MSWICPSLWRSCGRRRRLFAFGLLGGLAAVASPSPPRRLPSPRYFAWLCVTVHSRALVRIALFALLCIA